MIPLPTEPNVVLSVARAADERRCESCGGTADVVLSDDSKWCWSCHGSALRLGYDQETGTALPPFLTIARAAAASPSSVAAPPSAAGDGDTGPAREPVGSGKSPVAPGRSNSEGVA